MSRFDAAIFEMKGPTDDHDNRRRRGKAGGVHRARDRRLSGNVPMAIADHIDSIHDGGQPYDEGPRFSGGHASRDYPYVGAPQIPAAIVGKEEHYLVGPLVHDVPPDEHEDDNGAYRDRLGWF